MAVSTKEFIRFLADKMARKGKQIVCPMCGHDTLIVPGDPTIKSALPLGPIDAENPSVMAHHLPLVWARCDHCGHVMLFAKKFVDRWLAQNPASSPAITEEKNG